MPQVSNFFGIIVSMFYDEHNPPHFHAQYGEHRCYINIHTLSIIEGYLPPRALGLVIEWATLHQRELLDNWSHVERQEPIKKIAPL